MRLLKEDPKLHRTMFYMNMDANEILEGEVYLRGLVC